MKRHFIALDGLRGVAAILVLIGHASVLFRTGYTVERMLLAVQFFFMLSGFVIASAYDGRIGKGTTFFDFMTRRVIRLYPLILIGTSLGVIALAASGEALTTYKSAARVALAGANIPCIVCSGGEPFYFAINPPGWSLFFEMLAYATFAAGMWKLRLPTLMMVTGLLLLGSIYAAIQFTDHVPFRWHFVDASAAFFLGVTLFRIDRTAVRGAPFWMLAAAIIAICMAPRSWGFGIDIAAILIVFPTILACGAAEGRAPDKMLIWLGDLSYPLYMIHWPILVLVTGFAPSDPIIGMAGACLIAVVIARAVLTYVDEPVRSQLRRLVSQPERAHHADEGYSLRAGTQG